MLKGVYSKRGITMRLSLVSRSWQLLVPIGIFFGTVNDVVAQSADWIYIGGGLQIHKEFTQNKLGGRSSWVMQNYETPVTLGPYTYLSSASYMEFDCSGRSRTLSIVFYSGSSLSGKAVLSINEPGEISYIVPGSMGADMEKIFCVPVKLPPSP